MATRVTPKSALIEARWVIKILLGILGGLAFMFLMVGWITQSNITERMKACVAEREREWVNGECVRYRPDPNEYKLLNRRTG